jgi:phosphatidate cytidylyltransferase
MLRARILSAIILVPLIVLLVYLGGLPWLATMLVMGILAWLEMGRLLHRETYAADRLLGLGFIVAMLVAAYVNTAGWVQIDLFAPLMAALILLSLILALYDRCDRPTERWAMNLASTIYIGFLLSNFVTLRGLPDGLYWVIIGFAITWMYDAAAFFTGSALGRHKLWPRISPKKSWEGLIGGTVVAILTAVVLGVLLLGLSPWLGLLLGALVTAVAPFGDLSISLFKRAANAKDTGQLIPGHGGALDRLDSLFFTFAVVTYFAILLTAS